MEEGGGCGRGSGLGHAPTDEPSLEPRNWVGEGTVTERDSGRNREKRWAQSATPREEVR